MCCQYKAGTYDVHPMKHFGIYVTGYRYTETRMKYCNWARSSALKVSTLFHNIDNVQYIREFSQA